MDDLEKSKQANIVYHQATADTYRQQQPHYRPENVARIERDLRRLKELSQGERLLDLGCGMGFIIDIAKPIFSYIRGVDATPGMLEKVELGGGGDVAVSLGDVNALNFEDGCFDACTAHALLHHLPELGPALREAGRVLKKSGWLRTWLEPNAFFWELMISQKAHTVDYVQREITIVKQKDEQLANELGLEVEVVRLAEPIFLSKKGISEDHFRSALEQAGFVDLTFHYHWFLGEGRLMHDNSDPMAVVRVRDYLTEILPCSRPLFKYVEVTARKD
ncbi:MAG: class I SAM-dependent methyltransferase [Deltaproteobacteria bacterium]|jgi:ubiquinone/menaquinone biosynthesis C-methylase UbiE|nr:class I SAM-dependent methyltransferase [Deltaproteobacteria bacterium]